MTFYQELQLNQAGSKNIIRNSKNIKEKWYHIMVYLFKIMITVAFCFGFVTIYSILFGNDNSIVGVVVLLCLLVFKNADFGVHVKESTLLLGMFFVIFAVCPHLANLTTPFIGMIVNIIAISMIIFLGCHNPLMFNQSTLVLSYLLLYGYDVTGNTYKMRLLGLGVGACLTCLVFYRNHKQRTYQYCIKDLLKEFDIHSTRTRWQLCQILCVPIVVFIAESLNMPRSMWAGIAAMSAILPVITDMKKRVNGRIIGNIGGGMCFLVLYFLLPPSIYTFIGIIGGIGVGLSVKYSWQAVFNTFGALAIATEIYGLTNAISLRIIQNVFGVIFALGFCVAFNWLLEKISINNNEVVGA